MTNVRQISFLDHPTLIGTALYGVPMSAKDIALRWKMTPERSFEDLGDYDFLAVEVDGLKLGFRHLLNAPNSFCYVSCQLDDPCHCLQTIGRVCGIETNEIMTFEERW